MGLLWSHQNKLNISSSFVFSGTSKVDTVNMIYKRRKDSCRYGTKAKQSFESNIYCSISTWLQTQSKATFQWLSRCCYPVKESPRIQQISAKHQNLDIPETASIVVRPISEESSVSYLYSIHLDLAIYRHEFMSASAKDALISTSG